jgi:hypothetical protein
MKARNGRRQPRNRVRELSLLVAEAVPEPEDVLAQVLTRVANGVAERHAPGFDRSQIPDTAGKIARWLLK